MLFWKKEHQIHSPMTGRLLPLEDVPDEVFAKGMMGKGCAIIPEEGGVAAPIDGKVSAIAPGLHAIGLTGEDGIEVLIHFGLETYKGYEGLFRYAVKLDDKVKKGDRLLDIDLDGFRDSVLYTPIIITNSDDYEITFEKTDRVAKGEILLKYRRK